VCVCVCAFIYTHSRTLKHTHMKTSHYTHILACNVISTRMVAHTRLHISINQKMFCCTGICAWRRMAENTKTSNWHENASFQNSCFRNCHAFGTISDLICAVFGVGGGGRGERYCLGAMSVQMCENGIYGGVHVCVCVCVCVCVWFMYD